MVRNLQHARHKWERLTQVLIREGAYTQSLGKIYLAVVQVVLLYWSETWVLTPRMQRVLDVFHNRVAHRLMGRKLRKGRDGGLVYLLLEDAMAEARFQ